MKIELNVFLKMEDGSWEAFLEKKSELEFIPYIEDVINDNGLDFKVANRTFYLDGYVNLLIELVLPISDDRDKKEALERMKESGWTYRDDPLFDILKL